ncbi:MAG: hypothetical protein ACOX9A_10980 [Anaerolineae bacterium]|jgi:hypothetical protein
MNDVRQALSHVLWMGGSPCSGKTTISDILAERYDLQVYHCDRAWDDHCRRAHPEQHPYLYRLQSMTWDEIWMRPVDELLRDEMIIYREEFPMIVDDLLALPASRPVLAEGTALMPECVMPLLDSSHRAIWVLPTKEFQLYAYPRRGEWVQDLLSRCSHPDEAFRRWMDRDAAFADEMARRAVDRKLEILWVDGEYSIEENAARIAAHMGL